MVKILLSGCNGTMGKFIRHGASVRKDCEISGGLDINTASADGIKVFGNADDIQGEYDVIIDFSHPSALAGVLKYALSTKTPAVISTTGLSEEQINSIKLASSQIPIFYTANMSLGINLVAELIRKATAVLGSDYDIEIVEAHHNKKIDAPSGTALMLANAAAETLDSKPKYEYDRHSKREKRTNNEIGIHSVRGGTIVGEHEIIFAGDDEIITISHSARSKAVFATGALNAAVFLAGKRPGLYSMKELVDEA